MALKGFIVTLVGEDAVGECLLAYGVAAEDKHQALQLAEGAAQAAGYWSLEHDETDAPDDVDEDALGDVPHVIKEAQPVYLDEDDAYDDEDEADFEAGDRDE